MKAVLSVLAALTVASLLPFGPAAAGVGVRVTGGVGRISYGDFNDYVDNMNARMAAETLGVGTVDNIRWIPEFSGEVLYSFTPMMTAGLGVGILSGKSTFGVRFADNSYSFEHGMKAYPITGTVYVNLPPLPFAKPYVFGGGGVYYSKITFHESVTAGPDMVGYDAELTKWGFGLHGGAGLEIAIAPMVAADIGISGRYAKIRGFSGTATSSYGQTEDVFLAYYTSDGAVTYGPELATEKGAYGEGEVDLSGFAVNLSVKVSF